MITLISMEFGKSQIFLLSTHLPRYPDLNEELPNIQSILCCIQNKTLLVGGDFNCRSELWFDTRNSTRSNLLEEFSLQNNLDIANQPGNTPTFQSIHGQSLIDRTLLSNINPFRLISWETKVNITSSDHNPIQVKIKNLEHKLPLSTVANCKLDLTSIKNEELEPRMA